MVDLEHRFYGQSFPLADMSTESLRFLSADQVRTANKMQSKSGLSWDECINLFSIGFRL